MRIHRINDFENIKVGNIYSSKFNGYFKIIDITGQIYTIEFIETGYIKKTKLPKIRQGNLKDIYKPIVYGVGYLGENIKSSKLKRDLYTRWRNMLSRCYNESNKYYNVYGGNNVVVDKRWYNFYNFYHDVQKIDGWNIDKFLNKEISLDKDKYQKVCTHKVYSKDTCCWLSIKEQNSLVNFVDAHDKEMIEFIAIFPD